MGGIFYFIDIFWDIIIQADTHIVVFIVSVNVLFLSNSQRGVQRFFDWHGVYRKCQCPLFKQFTTEPERVRKAEPVFIVSVNVLFLSNSQPTAKNHKSTKRCLS